MLIAESPSSLLLSCVGVETSCVNKLALPLCLFNIGRDRHQRHIKRQRSVEIKVIPRPRFLLPLL